MAAAQRLRRAARHPRATVAPSPLTMAKLGRRTSAVSMPAAVRFLTRSQPVAAPFQLDEEGQVGVAREVGEERNLLLHITFRNDDATHRHGQSPSVPAAHGIHSSANFVLSA
ncbi:hypothetical protein [Mycobacterium sp. 050134]|uniref:hypothetical protein n=1 Tax=Mycobacterium sp. 050134 TaxID=3096111 RepID=UPI003FA577D0